MEQRNTVDAGEALPLRWVTLGWYYDQGGLRLGPFSNQEIQRYVAAGELGRGQTGYVGTGGGIGNQFRHSGIDGRSLGAHDLPGCRHYR